MRTCHLLSIWTSVAAFQRTTPSFRNSKHYQSSKCVVSVQLKFPVSQALSRRYSATALHASAASDNDGNETQDVSLSSSTIPSSQRKNAFLLICNPVVQFVAVMVLYTLHLVVLSSHALVFPFQVIPNNKGHFASIGWDSLAGLATFLLYFRYRRDIQKRSTQRLTQSYPWRLPSDNLRFRITSCLTTVALVQAYFWTGRFSLFWEDTVYSLSGLGFYITQPMKRSLCVLLGHLSWVAVGSSLLRWVPRPPKFFGCPSNGTTSTRQGSQAEDSETDSHLNPYRWFQCKIRNSSWLWWTIGGYFVSSWLFNMADGVNQYVLPQSLLLDQETSVVSQLITPEHNDVAASIIGYIAPCLSAPWWEEVLYRGFALPAAAQLLGYPSAVFWQGVVFSAHHMSLTAALPLAVLGWTWALLYRECRNLWVVMLVHGLWNSRVFICSWMGF